MFIVHVHVRVKPEYIDPFISATIENAQNSIKEPGVARFDVIQQIEDLTRFTLVEIYKDQEAALKHKETVHYTQWRDRVEVMMAEQRKSVKYSNIFPRKMDSEKD